MSKNLVVSLGLRNGEKQRTQHHTTYGLSALAAWARVARRPTTLVLEGLAARIDRLEDPVMVLVTLWLVLMFIAVCCGRCSASLADLAAFQSERSRVPPCGRRGGEVSRRFSLVQGA